jgi:hypothetical protein
MHLENTTLRKIYISVGGPIEPKTVEIPRKRVELVKDEKGEREKVIFGRMEVVEEPSTVKLTFAEWSKAKLSKFVKGCLSRGELREVGEGPPATIKPSNSKERQP